MEFVPLNILQTWARIFSVSYPRRLPWASNTNRWTVLAIVLSCFCALSRTFNLDTKMPVIKTVKSHFPDSYFGFSLAFSNETNDVYVGAPKAVENKRGEVAKRGPGCQMPLYLLEDTVSYGAAAVQICKANIKKHLSRAWVAMLAMGTAGQRPVAMYGLCCGWIDYFRLNFKRDG